MTKLLDRALSVARDLPPGMQDEIASFVLMMAGEEQPIIQLTPAEEASLELSLDQASRREFATNDQIRATWAKYGL